MIVNGVEKLICHFKPRKNYVVHYRNLRQYLEMGMRITAVHRGISFYQRPWMEPYIRKNTELRKTAANSFEKDFFKLMNNSVFGKTIENIRKRQNIEVVDNHISRDIKKKFDTSDYPPNHESGIPSGVNKKVIGMFKDEVAGKQITCFVGLRPKLYSFRIEEDKEVRKCKGIKKNVVKKKLDFDDYVQCLFSGKKQMRKMNIIRSENHDIYSKEVNKIALSNEDDKRKVL
ncbi:unnamed protein product, partial [Porites lobata]